MGLRDLRGEVSKQINCFDFQLECLESPKNISIYTLFGRNRSIETIDSYDGMVHRGPSDRGWSVWMNRADGRYKTRAIGAVGS